MKQKHLTRKELSQLTDVKPYVVAYYTSLGRLPLIHESLGAGDYNVYHPESINILLEFVDTKSKSRE
jgi:hypothetical protein